MRDSRFPTAMLERYGSAPALGLGGEDGSFPADQLEPLNGVHAPPFLCENKVRNRPSLRRIKMFEAIVRCGTIGRAAAEIGLSQPSVTVGLTKLEAEVCEPLIARGPAGSSPTAAGWILHQRAERMLRKIEAAAARLFGPDEAQEAAAVARNLTECQVRGHLAVDAMGSFRAAAAYLGVAEPSLNRSLRQLRNTVGRTLYQRTSFGFTTTPAGTRFASELRVALSEIDQALDELTAARGGANGRISLGCLPLTPKYFLADAVNAIFRENPGVQISVQEDDYVTLTQALHNGAVDLIIGALRSDNDNEFVGIPLFTDPYVLVVRRHHPLLSGEPLRDDQTAGFSWIVPWRGTPRRELIEAMFSRFGKRPHIAIETNSLAMTRAVLEESDCITVLSQSQFAMKGWNESLRVLQMQHSDEPRTVGVICRRDWVATSVQNAFLERLAANGRRQLFD